MNNNIFTPNIHTYAHMRPFRFWCQKVLPLVYDESLSYYELLCKVVDYLNKTMSELMNMGDDIKNLHDALEKLEQYVRDYFDNLDVQEEINKKLDELVQDGTLGGLIQNVIIRTPTSNFADMEYLCTDIRTYPTAGDSGEYEKVPTEPQGLVYVGNDNVVCFYSCGGGFNGYPFEDDTVLIREYHFTEQRTNSYIVREKLVSGLMHANACGYNPQTNEIYVALTGGSNKEKTAVNYNTNIAIVDYATFNVKSINTVDLSGVTNITPNDRIHEIGYDKIRNVLYGVTGAYVYKIDISTWKASLMFTWQREYNYAYVLEGMSVIDNYCYIGTHNPNSIFVYEVNTGNLLKIINIPTVDEDGHILRFPEDFDYDPVSLDFYINIWAGIGINNYGGTSQWRGCYVFKFNPFKNVITAHRQTESGMVNLDKTIYVNKNNKSIYQKGSSAYPYTTINEAINAITFATTDIFINVASGVYDEYINVQGLNVAFTGNAFTINSMNVNSSVCRFEQPVTLTGDYVTNHTVRLLNSKIMALTITVQKGYGDLSLFYCRGCTLTSEQSINLTGSGCKYAFYILDSILNCGFNYGDVKKIYLARSQYLKGFLPASITEPEINGACLIGLEAASNPIISSFTGRLQVVLTLTYNGTSRNVGSEIIRVYSGLTDIVLFVPTWFGFISVHLNSNLQLTSINNVNITGDDISGLSTTLLEYILN